MELGLDQRESVHRIHGQVLESASPERRPLRGTPKARANTIPIRAGKSVRRDAGGPHEGETQASSGRTLEKKSAEAIGPGATTSTRPN
jgi:hypothetical protein